MVSLPIGFSSNLFVLNFYFPLLELLQLGSFLKKLHKNRNVPLTEVRHVFKKSREQQGSPDTRPIF